MVLKINTMKYGGTDTGKALALYSQISFEEDDDKPELTTVYAICFLLSTLKREILGQEIEPITILQILLNDYSFNKGEINDSRCYVEEFGKNLFSEEESSEERND